MSVACVSDALARLESMAAAGSPPDDVAYEAEAIAAGWWWNTQCDLTPDRLVLLVQECSTGASPRPGITRAAGIT